MAAEREVKPLECNCAAIRHAARHVTQHYDGHLAAVGLRTTQFSILVKLRRLGPLTINGLAGHMGMDRTTLGRNILPLERDGLITIEKGAADQRSKELHITKAGVERMRAGLKHWTAAQAGYEQAVGPQRASQLRALLGAVVASDLSAAADEAR